MAKPVPKICSVNSLKTFRFDYQLTIKDYSSRTQIFDSEIFSLPGVDEPKFYLKCNPHYKNETNSEFEYKIDLYFQEKYQNKSIVYVTSIYTAFNDDGSRLSSKNVMFGLQTHETVGSIPIKAINYKQLLSGNLKMLIEFTMKFHENSSEVINIEQTSAKVVKETTEKLDQMQRSVDDFDKMLQSGKFSDFVLQLGEKKLRVHKNILAARSPYFAAMFTGDFEERKTNILEIADVNVELFEETIHFIYTGKIPSIDKNAAEFLVLSDKYRLDSLKSICENVLYDQLDKDTMMNTFLLADTHNAADLKAKTIEFISTRISSQDFIKAMLSHKNIPMFEALDDFEKNKK